MGSNRDRQRKRSRKGKNNREIHRLSPPKSPKRRPNATVAESVSTGSVGPAAASENVENNSTPLPLARLSFATTRTRQVLVPVTLDTSFRHASPIDEANYRRRGNSRRRSDIVKRTVTASAAAANAAAASAAAASAAAATAGTATTTPVDCHMIFLEKLMKKQADELDKFMGIKATRHASEEERLTALAKGVRKVVDRHFPYYGQDKKMRMIVESLVQKDLFGTAAGMKEMKAIAQSYARLIMETWRIVRTIDTSPTGGLNITGAGRYRAVELTDNQAKRTEFTCLPSSTAISRERNQLNRLIDRSIPIGRNEDPRVKVIGEHISVSKPEAFMLVLTWLNLLEKAKREPILVACSSDGAQLTRKRVHTSIGYKFLDHEAKHPKTGELLFVEKEEWDEATQQVRRTYRDCQNCDWYLVTDMVSAQESSKVYNLVFQNFFAFTDSLSKGLSPFRPVDIVYNGDMSAIQKITGRGGPCKNANGFCHCCGCHSKRDLLRYVIGDERCSMCKKNGTVKCRHWTFDDRVELDRKAERLFNLLVSDLLRKHGNEYDWTDSLPDDETRALVDKDTLQPVSPDAMWQISKVLVHSEEEPIVLKRSKMCEDPSLLSTKREWHIDFSPTTEGDFMLHDTHVCSELVLRNFPVEEINGPDSTYEARVALLRYRLKISRTIQSYRFALDLEEQSLPKRKFAPEDCILCMLHAENRTAERLLQCFLDTGLQKLVDAPGTSVEDKKAYVDTVESIINEKVLGKLQDGQVGQYRVPVDPKYTSIQKISIHNDILRKMLDNLHELLPYLLERHDTEEKEKWTFVIDRYRLVMSKLRVRSDMFEDEVIVLQGEIDEWADVWIELTGAEGMTNYIHMLVAGHFAYYLIRYKNLYRFSQQGWEGQNKKIKSGFNSSTQRGGHGASVRSQLLPIVMMLLRLLFWNFGIAESFFKLFLYPRDGEYQDLKVGKVRPTRVKLSDPGLKRIVDAVMVGPASINELAAHVEELKLSATDDNAEDDSNSVDSDSDGNSDSDSDSITVESFADEYDFVGGEEDDSLSTDEEDNIEGDGEYFIGNYCG